MFVPKDDTKLISLAREYLDKIDSIKNSNYTEFAIAKYCNRLKRELTKKYLKSSTLKYSTASAMLDSAIYDLYQSRLGGNDGNIDIQPCC